MKTLIIGMDGAQTSTFTRGWTPFIESLITKGEQLELREDLISRGWAEIYTGKHGIETGALYDHPSLKGNHDWSLSFKIGDVPNFGSNTKPIWQVLNDLGYSVGIMNVPTTFPAPIVNGFFVSGGGGGSKVIQDPTEELCYPKGILNTLKKIGYIVDERFGSLIYEKKYTKAKDIFSRLKEKNHKRTESFIKLSEDYKVDFGFVVYKSSSVIAELLLKPDWNRNLSGERIVEKELLGEIKKYYQTFDEQIKHLVKSFKEAEIILVSDHGMSETKYLVNINIFLQKNSFQYAPSSRAKLCRFRENAKKYLKPLVPFNIRHTIKQKTRIDAMCYNPIAFDRFRSAAFCMPIGDWNTGIYINDQDRFNGPVQSSEIREYAQSISSLINNDLTANAHSLKSYVKSPVTSPASAYFPDVVIDFPDGYIVSNSQNDFIVKFDMPTDPIGIKTWINNFKPYSMKAHSPIAVSTGHWIHKPSAEKQDLRLVYDHILSTFIVV